MTLNEALDRALLAYAELVRLDPEDWRDRTTIDELNESRDLDSSGLTTFMLLRALMSRLLSSTTFSAARLLDDPEAIDGEIRRLRDVRAAVGHPGAVRMAEEFAERLSGRLRALGAGGDVIERLLAEPEDLALLRRDALRSAGTLKAHAFAQGEREHDQLALNGTVFEFWNVNSLLSLVRLQNLGGTTLCLIRDPDQVMASFFVFAIKNGDDITLLSDREDVPHPAYWRMTRRPDRQLERRAVRHHFPYHLLDLEPTGDGGLRAASRTGLVRLQQELAPLARLIDLEPEEIAWIVMLHHQIAERYAGSRTGPVLPLSYTGEMLREPAALVGPGSALLRPGGYEPLDLKRLAPDDITAETTRAQWWREPIGANEWMIERYGARVPEAVLNLVGDGETKEARGAFPELLGIGEEEQRHLPFWSRVEGLALEAVLPSAFGTAEEIERDRVWAARVNQCRVVRREAEREYEALKGEVAAWYRERLHARLPVLLEATARGSLCLPSERPRADVAFSSDVVRNRAEAMRVVVGVRTIRDLLRMKDHGLIWSGVLLGRLHEAARLGYRCAVNPAKSATVFASIRPDCPAGLAELLGLTEAELPFGLRRWHRYERYHGNSILDRLDPSDWVLANPWEKMRLDVLIAISRSAYNAERKRLGLPWEPDTPVPGDD